MQEIDIDSQTEQDRGDEEEHRLKEMDIDRGDEEEHECKR
jgi:hypothetical protein